MTAADLQAYGEKKPGVSWDMPFGPDVLVFRVARKMFMLAPFDELRHHEPEVRSGTRVRIA
jgi:predicted DNA-binding protein (MmcQ/YjbR family)